MTLEATTEQKKYAKSHHTSQVKADLLPVSCLFPFKALIKAMNAQGMTEALILLGSQSQLSFL